MTELTLDQMAFEYSKILLKEFSDGCDHILTDTILANIANVSFSMACAFKNKDNEIKQLIREQYEIY